MDYLYRLSFDSQQDWHTLRNTLINLEELPKQRKVMTVQLLTGEAITINEVGNVPIPLEYDEVTGEPLTEQLYHDDWAVDVVTPIKIDELLPYVIESTKYYNSWSGNYTIIKPLIK